MATDGLGKAIDNPCVNDAGGTNSILIVKNLGQSEGIGKALVVNTFAIDLSAGNHR